MNNIVSLTANELVGKLKSGEISCVEVCKAFIERVEHKGRDQMIESARKGMKERQIEEQVGIRKSPDWLKERTERHLQKVRNVSS